MTKTHVPLLSLGARGSVSGAVTFVKAKGTTVAKTIPTPAYRQSLSQQYQRWLYKDASFYWKTLSDAEKAEYRHFASRYHLPIYAAFMEDYLDNWIDLNLLLPLDFTLGTIAYDLSPRSHHGAVTGTTPTSGLISTARSFDGIDDHILVSAHPTISLMSMSSFTIGAFARVTDISVDRAILGKGTGILLYYKASTKQWTSYSQDSLGVGQYARYTQAIALPDTFYRVEAMIDGSELSVWVNGIKGAVTDTLTGRSDDLALDLTIGNWDFPWKQFQGDIDHITLYSRALSQAQLYLLSQRRWP